jgi:hypothetical protein
MDSTKYSLKKNTRNKNTLKEKMMILVLVSLFIIPLTLGCTVKGIDTLSLDYPSSVMEGTQFIAIVTVQYIPVEGVLVQLSGQQEYTNQYGMAVLTAPIVTHSQKMYISAEKEGYVCPISEIFVKDSGDIPPEQLLEISVPSSVNENTFFELSVFDLNKQGIDGATVTMEWSDFQAVTDSSGAVNLTAPSVETTTEYAIMVTASGYLPNAVRVEVIKKPQLEIDASPTVYERDSFTVTITANSNPVSGALVSFNNRGALTNASGQVQFIAPPVENSLEVANYLITTSKTNYLPAEAWITVLKQGGIIPMGPQQLLITAPSSVTEGETFLVMITDNRTGDPIDDATVEFANTQYSTDEDGIITIPAPYVEHNTSYTLVASKERWQSDTAPIMILNEENQLPIQEIGWISGRVTDTTGSGLSDVQVCIISSNGDTCESTNEQGRYTLSVSPGTYIVEASREGYVTDTEEVTVSKNTYAVADFSLEPVKSGMIDYAIEWGIDNNVIDADIQFSDEQTSTIQIYNTGVTVAGVTTLQGSLSFTVTGPVGTTGVFLLRIKDPETLFNNKISYIEKNLQVKIDGVSLQRTEIEQILSSSNSGNEQQAWTVIIFHGETYVLVKTPFSEHQITISTVEEVLSGLFAIGVYIAICVILALFIVIPIFFIEKQ